MAPVPKPRSDEAEFQAALRGEDLLGVVVRAHIRIELCLNDLVTSLVVDRAAVDKMNLEYAQLVHLAVALGLKDEYAPPLLAMGTLRNHFAHRADAQLGRQEITNLFKALPANDRGLVVQAYDRTKTQLDQKALPSFRQLPPKEQLVFIAIGLRAALEFALEDARRRKSAA